MTAKKDNFASVDHVAVRDPYTCVVHLNKPDASLLFNMSDELSAVVERGAGKAMGEHPIGTGPFRFVREAQDQEVVLERQHGLLGWIAACAARAVCRGAGRDYTSA